MTPELVALGVVKMSTVQPERIRWLWDGRIPHGKLTILEGDPKVGKSTLALDIAARVTTGTPFADGCRPEVGTVLVMTAEDGLNDTVRPRLDAAGADASRVIAWEWVPELNEAGEPVGMRPPSVPRDLPALEALITAHGVVLVVVDVLNAYLGADVDGHKDQDVRRALMPLAKLAERTGAAVVVLRHLKKDSSGPALYRGAGSIGIAGAARSILLVGFDPDDETRRHRILASQGSNVAEPPGALAYELVNTEEHGCARVAWIGVSEHTTGTLLATSSDEDRSALSEACDVLSDILGAGPVGAKDVERRASEAGVSKRTLDRAKARLGVRSLKSPAGRWEWVLPDAAEAPEGCHSPDEGRQGPYVGTLGNLPSDQELFGPPPGKDAKDAKDASPLGSGDLGPPGGAAAVAGDDELFDDFSASEGEPEPVLEDGQDRPSEHGTTDVAAWVPEVIVGRHGGHCPTCGQRCVEWFGPGHDACRDCWDQRAETAVLEGVTA